MNKTTKLALFAGVALALTGCSFLQKQNAKTVNSGDARPLFPVTTQVTTSTGKPVDLAGRWYIKTVGTLTLNGIEDADWPYIEFEPSEGRFYGNNGCNVLNGSYRVGSDQAMSFSDLATTMRLCPEDSIEFLISDALNRTVAFSTAPAPGGGTILSLHNDQNWTLMSLRKSEISFLAGPWRVVEINATECDAPDATLIFDTNANKITGNAGCNRLSGDIQRDPMKASSVQFSNLATTRMTCPYIQTESALLIALEEVTGAKISGNTLELTTSSGKTVIKLKKLSKSDLSTSE